jgi:hypothetical protein
LAWSGKAVHLQLAALAPDVVVAISTRAFDARALAGPWELVLDQVDSLARSYHDRAALVHGPARQLGYRALSALHARVEHRLHREGGNRRVAAGWTDALTLGAEWVPNTIDESLVPITGGEPDHDVLFFGTLRYPPNVDALERMARCWTQLLEARPGTTGLVAGSAPTDHVRALCDANGWELVADFPSLPGLAARARVAFAPLTHVAGIQNKVLDAATLRLPQVVTLEALEGFDPSIPLVGLRDDDALVGALVRLLEDPATAISEAASLRDHVVARYGATAWAPWARGFLDHSA